MGSDLHHDARRSARPAETSARIRLLGTRTSPRPDASSQAVLRRWGTTYKKMKWFESSLT